MIKKLCSYLSMVAHQTLRNGIDLQLVSYVPLTSAHGIHTGWKTASSAIPAEPKGDISAIPSSIWNPHKNIPEPRIRAAVDSFLTPFPPVVAIGGDISFCFFNETSRGL